MGAQTYPQGPTGMNIPAAPKATWSPAHEQSRLDTRATSAPSSSSYTNPYVAPAPSFQPIGQGSKSDEHI